ncbi:unnamed protein product [Schistosoma curassoni]|uniref:Ras-associating domain-containing protein n=1 Tax=Schistosoma curassoni TaxID=6186 RepID=A0A183JU20_9TREM|nr:unnamed protein product [Schistosoma curassoni]
MCVTGSHITCTCPKRFPRKTYLRSGTLKIYGGQLFPEIPYKTLLISITDNVAYILRESLNKYGLDEADPDAYCLVMRKRNSHDILTGLVGVEEILSDEICPLEYLLTSLSTTNSSSTVIETKSIGDTLITFEVRYLKVFILYFINDIDFFMWLFGYLVV